MVLGQISVTWQYRGIGFRKGHFTIGVVLDQISVTWQNRGIGFRRGHFRTGVVLGPMFSYMEKQRGWFEEKLS